MTLRRALTRAVVVVGVCAVLPPFVTAGVFTGGEALCYAVGFLTACAVLD